MIDLTGSGDNSLNLSLTDLVNLSHASNLLRATGNCGDSVSGGCGWIYRGDIAVGGQVYAQYTRGAARLQVDTDMDRSGVGFTINLGTNGFRLEGAAISDQAGTWVSGVGDVNGDGFADLAVGAVSSDLNGPNSGGAYAVFGGSGGFATSISLSTVDGSNGFRLSGAVPYVYAGGSVSGAGDVNGDGVDDLPVGASGADPNGLGSGAVYTVCGGISTAWRWPSRAPPPTTPYPARRRARVSWPNSATT